MTAQRPIDAPELSSDEKRQVLAAAALRVCDTVLRRQAPPLSDELGPLGDRLVGGAFVSLKNGADLRSCCGVFGETKRLVEAVDRAAVQSAANDPRFPPILAGELDALEVEVWLLGEPHEVSALGDARAAAVEVGRHGLQVVRKKARGLLLPSVPVRYGWTAAEFLEQTCRKAGLSPAAWREPTTRVFTFEGANFGGAVREYREIR
jgi:AmmeMemoRadiSam system protein A